MQCARMEGISGHAQLAHLGLFLWLQNAYQPLPTLYSRTLPGEEVLMPRAILNIHQNACEPF